MAGPIGAINNGIDFIESKNPDMKKIALELLSTSSKQAISNLTFLRQAYGFISDDAEVSFYTMKTLINNFLKETKVTFEMSNQTKREVVNGQVAKLIYNLTIMVAALMMYSGVLSIAFNNDTITITSTAPVHKVDKNLESLLKGNTSPTTLTTRNIQVAFTQVLIAALGYEVTIDYNAPNLLIITLTTV